MSTVPTMVDLPVATYDQPMQDLFRLAGQPDGVVCHQANADGSGFIFMNGTFQLLSADEYSRYLLGLPLGVNMEVDGPVNQSSESIGSSIYSMPGLANISTFEAASKDCQPGCVPPPCHADGFNISLDCVQDNSQLYPPILDLFPSDSYTPAQADNSGSLTDVFSEAPLKLSPVGTVQLESTTHAEDAAKHKTLFGNSGILDRRRSPRIKLPPREPKRDIPHDFNLQFLNLTVRDSMPGSGKDKDGNPISLGPLAQAVLYFELNIMLIEAINAFLVQQNKAGHIAQETIGDVNKHWAFKGFPPVADFLWDLSHQRSLVGMNLEQLQFAGRSSVNFLHLQGILGGWKILARDAGRNILCPSDCVPDALVRRHLSDARDLLEAVNVPEATFTAFADFHDHAKLLMFS